MGFSVSCLYDSHADSAMDCEFPIAGTKFHTQSWIQYIFKVVPVVEIHAYSSLHSARLFISISSTDKIW